MVDKYFATTNDDIRLRNATHGCKMQVLWKDGSFSWVPLKDLKESSPVEVIDHAKPRGVDGDTAFTW